MERIGSDVVATSNGHVWVSTVCLSPAECYDEERYETMIFRCTNEGKVTNWGELFCDRYETQETAAEGHARVVAGVRDGTINVSYRPRIEDGIDTDSN